MLLVSLHFNRFTSIPLRVTEKLGVNPILRPRWNSLLKERFGKSFWEVKNNHPLVKLLCQYSRISLSQVQSTCKVFPVISSSHLVTVFFPTGHTVPLLCACCPPQSVAPSPCPLLGFSYHTPWLCGPDLPVTLYWLLLFLLPKFRHRSDSGHQKCLPRVSGWVGICMAGVVGH